jgi:PAS domain-containing protein
MQAGQPLEIIQARNLIGRLNTASFLVDPDGTLIFYNDAAADLLGMSFEEAGPMESGTWGTKFRPREPGGREIPVGDLPLSVAVQSGRPGSARMQITAASGEDHEIDVCALPIMGMGGEIQRGSLAIFWPIEGDDE